LTAIQARVIQLIEAHTVTAVKTNNFFTAATIYLGTIVVIVLGELLSTPKTTRNFAAAVKAGISDCAEVAAYSTVITDNLALVVIVLMAEVTIAY